MPQYCTLKACFVGTTMGSQCSHTCGKVREMLGPSLEMKKMYQKNGVNSDIFWVGVSAGCLVALCDEGEETESRL